MPVKQSVLANMNCRPTKLNEIIADDTKLAAAFQQYIETWKPIMNTWIQPYQGKYLPSLYKKGLLPSIINENKNEKTGRRNQIEQII